VSSADTIGDTTTSPTTASTLAKATYVNSYRGGPLLYTNPPGGVPEPA
jgi:hypothetical protein